MAMALGSLCLAQTTAPATRPTSQPAEVVVRTEAADIEREGPTLITLHLKDANAEDVYNEIARQAKVKFSLEELRGRILPNGAGAGWPSGLPKVSIDVDRRPFWVVVKEVTEQCNIGPAQYSGASGDAIPLSMQSTFGRLPGVVSGAFYITPTRASRSQSVEYGNAQDPAPQFSMNLSVYPDPKLKVLRGSYQLDVKEAVDDLGHSLVAPGKASGTSSSGGFRHDMTVPLVYAPGTGSKLARLNGTAQFTVLVKSESWIVADALKVNQATHDTPFGKCIIKQLTRKSTDQYQLEVLFEGRANDSMAAVAGDVSGLQRNIRLLDANDRPWQAYGGGSTSDGTHTECRLIFMRNRGPADAPGEPAKLIWEIPLQTREMTVTVELKDLLLP
jgi:hypothetical protein